VENGEPEQALSVLRKALEHPPSRTKSGQATYQYAEMALGA